MIVVFNAVGCEAMISGPLDSEGAALWLSILELNETHPAVVRCQVTCLNQQGACNPVMALIITSQEQFIIVRGSITRDELLYEIHFQHISYCEAQNNCTMEFEFLIYSNSSKLDQSVLQCGVVCIHPSTSLPIVSLGQAYGIIRFTGNTKLTTTTISSDSNMCPTTTMSNDIMCTTSTVTIISNDSNMCSPTSGVPLPTTSISVVPIWTLHSLTVRNSQVRLLSLITIPIVVVVVSIISFAVGLLYMRSRKKVAVHEEQVLVMNVVHNTTEEEATTQRIEEELLAEQASNPSPTHNELNQKMPDTISSRNSKY